MIWTQQNAPSFELQFLLQLNSSLKHDYLRTRANPPSKSTPVHEAVMKQQQPISFYLDPVIWGGFSSGWAPDSAERPDVNAAASQHCVIYNERSQAKPPRSEVRRFQGDKHQSGRRGAPAHLFSLSHLVLILSSKVDKLAPRKADTRCVCFPGASPYWDFWLCPSAGQHVFRCIQARDCRLQYDL